MEVSLIPVGSNKEEILRIVHLDLKGAPLKLPFLEKVLKCIKRWGGTGILIEWEDSFPYAGDIADIGSLGDCSGDGMYSVEEVRHIFHCARENDLEVIQLIQTIGHLEFVLKHPVFKMLQEKPRAPAVLCPSKSNSQSLVRAMVQQALDAQPDAKYFHIGADEVWYTAVCVECQYRAASNRHGRHCLYLEHIRELALFIKQYRPDVTVLLWDDMFRSISLDILQFYNLGELVQPVVWDYNVKQHFRLNPHMWNTYRMLFPNVWAGSAFKGANGSCKVYPVIDRYLSYQEAWIDEVKKNSDKITFAGVILTGWSRYDHFATLCELLPASMECLKRCLNMWVERCNFRTECYMGNEEELPGQEIYDSVKCYEVLRERADKLLQSDLVATWMNPWQIQHRYTNPTQIEAIMNESKLLLRELTRLQSNFVHILLNVTGSRSCDEWIGTFTTPLLKKLTELQDAATKCGSMDASVKPA